MFCIVMIGSLTNKVQEIKIYIIFGGKIGSKAIDQMRLSLFSIAFNSSWLQGSIPNISQACSLVTNFPLTLSLLSATCFRQS